MEELERIIRPIVEGQIRGFLKEHPEIVEAVTWYKPRKDKAQTFVNSLSKRIVRDLTCRTTSARIEAAVLALRSERLSPGGNGTVPVPASGRAGIANWLGRFWKLLLVRRQMT